MLCYIIVAINNKSVYVNEKITFSFSLIVFLKLSLKRNSLVAPYKQFFLYLSFILFLLPFAIKSRRERLN